MNHLPPTGTSYRRRAALAAASGLAAVCLLPGALAAQPVQPGIVVAVAPDSAGPGLGACPGCDGEFTTVDALAGTTDPLPALVVTLRDAAGTVLARQTTRSEPFGRQVARFVVAAPGRFRVSLAELPGWEPCPRSAWTREVPPEAFGPDGTAHLAFALWRGCAAPGGAADGNLAPTDAFTVTPGVVLASPSTLAPSADGLRLPQAGAAVQSLGRLMFGLAATAATLGLLGLAFESGFVRRS